MTARAISRQVYRDHIANGKALTQWMKVLRAIEARPRMTRAELERATGIRLTSVCGRVKELLDADVIAEVANVRCSVTGNVVHGLIVREPGERALELFAA